MEPRLRAALPLICSNLLMPRRFQLLLKGQLVPCCHSLFMGRGGETEPSLVVKAVILPIHVLIRLSGLNIFKCMIRGYLNC